MLTVLLLLITMKKLTDTQKLVIVSLSFTLLLLLVRFSTPVVVSGDYDTAPKNATHLRIAAAHKTIGEKTFLLAVVIFEA